MRRLVVALIAVVMVVFLAGCGGGGEEEPAPAETEEAPAAAAPAAAGELDPVPDRSRPETAVVFEPFPEGDSLPKPVTDRIADRQPMAILFVDGSQLVTDEVREALDDAIEANSGAVDLVVYDIGKYVSIDSSGIAVVDAEGLGKDSKASQAAVLAAALKVTVAPYIILTDDQGYVVFRHRGLVDREQLEMQMERLVD